MDGNDSYMSNSSSDKTSDISTDCSTYDTDDEAFPQLIPANLSPVPDQNEPSGQPIIFNVYQKNDLTSPLPLCLLFNSRSVYNKSDNMNEMLNQICPDLCLISESWEREHKRLSSVLSKQFKIFSYYCKTKSPGGGCAIVFNEKGFQLRNWKLKPWMGSNVFGHC